MKYDIDKEFLLKGLSSGFELVDSDKQYLVVEVEVNNHLSSVVTYKNSVENQIHDELKEGNYIRTSKKPIVVSALSAIPKSNGKEIRLIHDFSKPDNLGVNNYATKDPFFFQSIQDVLEMIKPGWFLAKVDLKSAYRSVGIHPSNFKFTGLKWTFEGDVHPTYMFDGRLPFGARKSPSIFSRLTQAVCRIMARKGYQSIVCYLDDFLITGPNFQECLAAYNSLLALLRSLGFKINWQKVIDPCQKLVFLGIEIDTVMGTISLEQKRVNELQDILCAFLKKKRATRKQLERLAGKLSWASCVLPWSRLHIRRTFDLMMQLKHSKHKCRISSILPDIQWWLAYIHTGNHTKLIWDERPTIPVFCDASLHAGGAFSLGAWIFTHWNSDQSHLESAHINIKELAMVLEAAKSWCKWWSGHRIAIFTDNTVTAAIINKGTSPCSESIGILQELSYLCLKYNFSITATHIPGKENCIADAISRLFTPGYIQKLLSLLANWWMPHPLPCAFWLPCHMSNAAINFLSPQIREWQTLYANLTQKWLHGYHSVTQHPLRQPMLHIDKPT